jgi:hypothetical protein
MPEWIGVAGDAVPLDPLAHQRDRVQCQPVELARVRQSHALDDPIEVGGESRPDEAAVAS